MKKELLLSLLLCVLCSTHTTAQTYYYYYKDKKMPLTLNENKLCINIPKEYDKTCERIRDNVQVLVTMSDKIFDTFIITRSEYEKLTSHDFWEEDAQSVILTSSYFNESNKEVFLTPYLSVELKKEDDKELLASYAEENKLRILGDGPYSPFMPLLYSLYITLDSKKSPLEYANELQESGNYAYSIPDLTSVNNTYTIIPNITTAKTDASTDIYDLQGRKLTSKPAKGIYIQQGKKKLVESR